MKRKFLKAVALLLLIGLLASAAAMAMEPLPAAVPFEVEGEPTPGTVMIDITACSPEAPLPERTEFEGEDAR